MKKAYVLWYALQMFFCMQIQRDGDTGDISKNQSPNIEDMLQRHSMRQCGVITTPFDIGYQVSCDEKMYVGVDATECLQSAN